MVEGMFEKAQDLMKETNIEYTSKFQNQVLSPPPVFARKLIVEG
jgi:hypothetical protein